MIASVLPNTRVAALPQVGCSPPNSAIEQIPDLERTPMQRRLSALTIWIVVAALVRGLAVTNLDHCGQSTLPGTDEIVCLCQYVYFLAGGERVGHNSRWRRFDDYHQDLDDIDLQTMIRVEVRETVLLPRLSPLPYTSCP